MPTLPPLVHPAFSTRRALRQLCPTLLLLAVGNALATPFSYQGTLYSQGEPAQGPHRMRLALYTAASGGLLVAKALELEDVQVDQGRFNADAELPPSIDQYDTLWLQVSVDDGRGTFVDLPQREMFQPKAANACWSTSGNTGTDALVDFLGTTDAQLRRRGQRLGVAQWRIRLE